MAATMSTVSAGINALTGTVLVDFVRGTFENLESTEAQNRTAVLRARLLTFGFGTFITVIALFAGRLGTLVEAPVRIAGLLGGPLLGIFLLAAFSRRTDGTSVLFGTACGGIACYLAFAEGWSFLWLGLAGTLVTLVAGRLAAQFVPHDYHPNEACLYSLQYETEPEGASVPVSTFKPG
jgi:Na+/proline symporter